MPEMDRKTSTSGEKKKKKIFLIPVTLLTDVAKVQVPDSARLRGSCYVEMFASALLCYLLLCYSIVAYEKHVRPLNDLKWVVICAQQEFFFVSLRAVVFRGSQPSLTWIH